MQLRHILLAAALVACVALVSVEAAEKKLTEGDYQSVAQRGRKKEGKHIEMQWSATVANSLTIYIIALSSLCRGFVRPRMLGEGTCIVSSSTDNLLLLCFHCLISSRPS
jgi:hypothetical protein